MPDPSFAIPPIALSLAGLPGPAELPAREMLARASSLGFRSIALDATRPGMRPRELDRSARRDLAASMRRVGLGLAGVDCFIPPEHFLDPSRADRALTSALQAIEFAGELAALADRPAPGWRPALVMALARPSEADGGWLEALGTLVNAGERAGVLIGDSGWPPLRPAEGASVRIALDPAGVLLAGADPSAEVIRLASRIAQARLSDLSPAGRVAPGVTPGGRLAVEDYLPAVVASGGAGPAVLDLRNVPQPLEAAERVAARFVATRPR